MSLLCLGEKLIPKSDYTPSHNGCGTFGAEVRTTLTSSDTQLFYLKSEICRESCGVYEKPVHDACT